MKRHHKHFISFMTIYFFLAIILFFISIKSYGGLPPTTARGAKDTSSPVTFNTQVPNNMNARVNSTTAYSSQVQKNWLIDPDFMDSTLTRWSISGGTQTRDTSIYLNNGASRKIATTFSAGTYTNLIYQQFTPTQSYPGINFEGDVWIYFGNALVQYRLCFGPTANLPSLGTSTPSFCTNYAPSTTSRWNKLSTFYAGLVSGTQYTFTVDAYNVAGNGSQNDSVYVSDAYFGPAISIGTGTLPNTLTANVSATAVISVQTGANNWLSSCSISDTSLFTCNFAPGTFTVAPSCSAGFSSVGDFTNVPTNISVGVATASSVTIRTSYNSTKAAEDFKLFCTKTNADFVQPTIATNSPEYWTGVLSGSGATVTSTSSVAFAGSTTRTATSSSGITVTGGSSGTFTVLSNAGGVYSITISPDIANSGAGNYTYFRLTDGTTNSSEVFFNSPSANVEGFPGFTQLVTTLTPGVARTITIQGRVSAGTGTFSQGQLSIVPNTQFTRIPQLIGSVTSDANNALKFEAANLNNTNGSGAVNSSTSSWITLNGGVSPGINILNISGFSTAPYCTCSANAANATQCTVYNITSTTLNTYTLGATGTAANENNVKLICLGTR